jgi:hypothetical protein
MIDLVDLERRAQGTESVGISNATLRELLALIKSKDADIERLTEALAQPRSCETCGGIASRSGGGDEDLPLCEDCYQTFLAEHLASVCPGCHAVGQEPCAPGCIDAAIAADPEDAIPCLPCGRVSCTCGSADDDEACG